MKPFSINFLKNDTGASMLQMMLVGAAVFAMGTGVFKLSTKDSKQSQSLLSKIQVKSFIQGITDTLADPQTCKATLSQAGELRDDLNLPNGIVNASSQVVYKVSSNGDATYNGRLEIQSVKISDYSDESGFFLKKLRLKVTTKPFYAGNATTASFHTYEKSSYIPVWAVVEDNNVLNCLSGDETGIVLSTFIETCSDLGGTYNPDNGKCEGILETIKDSVAAGLCDPPESDTCEHPYENQKCSGTDLRGVSYNNWVITGFNNSGGLNCGCVPITCPNPASVCYGVDMGTNHCAQNCGTGTKTTGGCCTYSPSPSTVCEGEAFSMIDSCGVRPSVPAVGTKTSGECAVDDDDGGGDGDGGGDDEVCDPSGWTPAPSTKCDGVSFEQTNSSCSDKRTRTGTKTTGECEPDAGTCSAEEWTPQPNTKCDGISFEQSCSKDGSKRTVTGTKTTGECKVCDDTKWTPKPNTVCKDKEFEQTNNTCPAGEGTRTVTGTKTTGECEVSDGCNSSAPKVWIPEIDSFCTGTCVEQVNRDCPSERRTVVGTGTVNCIQGPNAPCNCTPGAWSPATSDVCEGEKFEQTDGCNKREATGTKKGCDPCAGGGCTWQKIIGLGEDDNCATITLCSVNQGKSCSTHKATQLCSPNDTCNCSNAHVCVKHWLECRK